LSSSLSFSFFFFEEKKEKEKEIKKGGKEVKALGFIDCLHKIIYRYRVQ
jgi:hypothetical protein